ncbi:hypothetical protein A0H81_06555 [Grifola frondosa]|uniref:Uncharacterized protein n=1 Tax=Grifola frondosa TaxID=5627 RepID=A0A1C7MAK7_GRIFR|nr:hypothetical protein A0H81_06555 [Grifola frondosa]
MSSTSSLPFDDPDSPVLPTFDSHSPSSVVSSFPPIRSALSPDINDPISSTGRIRLHAAIHSIGFSHQPDAWVVTRCPDGVLIGIGTSFTLIINPHNRYMDLRGRVVSVRVLEQDFAEFWVSLDQRDNAYLHVPLVHASLGLLDSIRIHLFRPSFLSTIGRLPYSVSILGIRGMPVTHTPYLHSTLTLEHAEEGYVNHTTQTDVV